MLKGHADIYLMDAESGSIVDERHEDNIVTNAVQELLSMNPFAMKGGCNVHVPLATKALGGVLLFPNSITEDATKYFARNQWPTGYAGQNSDPNGDVRRGNFNPNESYATSNGYKLTWDFGTADANGDIAAICLTNKNGGENYEYSLYGNSQYSGNTAINISFMANSAKQIIDAYYGGYAYKAEWSGSGAAGTTPTLNIRKWALAPNRQPVYRSYEIDNSTTEYIDLSNTHVVREGSQSGAKYYRYVYWDKYGMRILSTDELTAMSTGYWYVTTVAYDGTVSEVAIPYSDMTDININVRPLVIDGWCYIPWNKTDNGTKKIGFYAVELANTSNINEIESSITGYEFNTYYSSNFKFRVDVNTPVCIYTLTGQSKNWLFALADGDFILDELKTSGADNESSVIYGNAGPFVLVKDGNASEYLLAYKCTYLATINNLGSPITKTADRTLKVVYTLTEA